MKELKSKITWLFVSLALLIFCFGLVACKDPTPGPGPGPDPNNGVATLSTPGNLSIVDEFLIWDQVPHATGYAVFFNDVEYEVTTNQFDTFELVTEYDVTYSMQVMAIGDGVEYGNSQMSKAFKYRIDYIEGMFTIGPKYNEFGLEGYFVAAGNKNLLKGKIIMPTKYGEIDLDAVYANGFKECTQITSVYFPDSCPIEEIDTGAFENCTALKRVRLSPSIKRFMGSCFKNTAIEEITLNEGFNTLGANDFEDCKKLKSVILPDTLANIGDYTFKGCSALKSVVLPKSLKNIEDRAFQGSSLTSIIFSEEHETYKIEGNCLIRKEDYALVSMFFDHSVIPSYVKIIEEFAIKELNIEQLDIPEGVEEIKELAIYLCPNLKVVSIPASVKILEANFVRTPNNSNYSIEIDENSPYFKMDGNCIISKQDNKLVQGFINSVIPDYVKIIGKGAFNNVGLTTLTLPSTVEVIEENAFGSNKIKGTIIIPETIKEIGMKAFYFGNSSCYDTVVILPKAVLEEDLDYVFTGCTVYTDKTEKFVITAGLGNVFINCKLAKDGEERIYLESVPFKVMEDGQYVKNLDIAFGSVFPSRPGYKIKGWSLEPNSAEIYREAIYDNDTKLYQTTSLLSEMEKYLENMKLPDDTVFYVVYEKDGGLVQT